MYVQGGINGRIRLSSLPNWCSTLVCIDKIKVFLLNVVYSEKSTSFIVP
jgi:hypothetical protein